MGSWLSNKSDKELHATRAERENDAKSQKGNSDYDRQVRGGARSDVEAVDAELWRRSN
jgi:hypothetical protein